MNLPVFLGVCEDFCCDRVLFLLLFFLLPPVALTERSNTSLALKNATRKGCLDCGPLLPMMPADFMLMLLPSPENKTKQTNKNIYISHYTGFGIFRRLYFLHRECCIGIYITDGVISFDMTSYAHFPRKTKCNLQTY